MATLPRVPGPLAAVSQRSGQTYRQRLSEVLDSHRKILNGSAAVNVIPALPPGGRRLLAAYSRV